MGQLWTDEMQADLERWQTSLEGAKALPSRPIDSESFHLRDILHGLALYVAAVIRHRVLRGAPPVWSLAQQCDYAAFLRRLGEPLDPEIEALIEAELDIFDGMKMYNA
jgi:hypothetical protein